MAAVPSDTEKREVWDRYATGRPTRVPLRWNVNPRIILLDPSLNPEGWTFEQYSQDPDTLLRVQVRFQEYCAEVLASTCDFPAALPEAWSVRVDTQNIFDAAYFQAPVVYKPGQVPATRPPYSLGDVDAFLSETLPPPADNPWLGERLDFLTRVEEAARSFRWRQRPARVAPFLLPFDGPVTVAANLFDANIFLLMAEDPARARQVFEKITREAARRNAYLAQRAGVAFPAPQGGLADDSVQLITTRMYQDLVAPVHESWYRRTTLAGPESGKRSMHLCGDATRHFPYIHEQLGVGSFDTGFPVDHGALREVLGDDVEICGGPPVSVLLEGTPEVCARAAREILGSGVMRGGRFILQEGNNLPPRVPVANLEAVYQECLTVGRYE